MLTPLARICQHLQRGILEQDDAAELLTLLGAAVNASAVALATPMAWGGFNLNERLPDDWPRVYMPVREWDPLLQRVCDPGVGTWVRGNEDVAHLHGDNPCAETFFAYGFVDCLGLRVRNPQGADHCLAIYREAGKRKFTVDERNAMDMLVPHISAALRSRTAQRALEVGSNTGEPSRTVILRYFNRTAEWSEGARQLIRAALPDVKASTWPKLNEVLFKAAHRFYSAPMQCSIPVVGSIRADFAILRGQDRQSALLATLSDAPLRMAKIAALPFEELLTPGERRLARSLARGITLEDAAGSHRISRETAKSHLKSVYRTLRISTRAELAKLYTDF